MTEYLAGEYIAGEYIAGEYIEVTGASTAASAP